MKKETLEELRKAYEESGYAEADRRTAQQAVERLEERTRELDHWTWEDAIRALSKVHNSASPRRAEAWRLIMHRLRYEAEELDREAATPRRRHLTVVTPLRTR